MPVYQRIFRGEFSVILTEPVPYTFVSVYRSNNKAPARASLFRRFTDRNVQGAPITTIPFEKFVLVTVTDFSSNLQLSQRQIRST